MGRGQCGRARARPASSASCQRSAHRHHDCPLTRPGKPYWGMGVVRSLPTDREYSRNSSVTTQHTTCSPGSSPWFSQQPGAVVAGERVEGAGFQVVSEHVDLGHVAASRRRRVAVLNCAHGNGADEVGATMATGTGALGDVGEQWVECDACRAAAAVGTGRANGVRSTDMSRSCRPATTSSTGRPPRPSTWPTSTGCAAARCRSTRRCCATRRPRPTSGGSASTTAATSLALADLLPLLAQLGFRALDERVVQLRPRRRRTRAPARRRRAPSPRRSGRSADAVRAELQRTFVDTFAGTSRSTRSTSW